MNLSTFTEQLINAGLVHPLAIFDADEFDGGATRERVYRLWEIVR